jgi:hypothetical protein
MTKRRQFGRVKTYSFRRAESYSLWHWKTRIFSGESTCSHSFREPRQPRSSGRSTDRHFEIRTSDLPLVHSSQADFGTMQDPTFESASLYRKAYRGAMSYGEHFCADRQSIGSRFRLAVALNGQRARGGGRAV